jgi:hypothetical protein
MTRPVESTRFAWRASAGGTPAGAITVRSITSGSLRSAATRRPSAALTAGSAAPPGRCVSTTIWCGASAPGPSVVSRTCRPCVDSVVSGTPRLSPPVSLSPSAGSASASIRPPAQTKNSNGRFMIAVARPCQKPVTSLAARRSSTRLG